MAFLVQFFIYKQKLKFEIQFFPVHLIFFLFNEQVLFFFHYDVLFHKVKSLKEVVNIERL